MGLFDFPNSNRAYVPFWNTRVSCNPIVFDRFKLSDSERDKLVTICEWFLWECYHNCDDIVSNTL